MRPGSAEAAVTGWDLFKNAFGLFAAFLRKELGCFPVEKSVLQESRTREKVKP